MRNLLITTALLASLGCSAEDRARDECQEHCTDGLVFFECVSGDVVQACANACESSTLATVGDFNRCMDSASICGGVSCLQLFTVEAEQPEPNRSFYVDRCNNTCTDLLSCVGSTEVQECLAACEDRSTSQLKSFASCASVTNTCQENSECLITLGL